MCCCWLMSWVCVLVCVGGHSKRKAMRAWRLAMCRSSRSSCQVHHAGMAQQQHTTQGAMQHAQHPQLTPQHSCGSSRSSSSRRMHVACQFHSMYRQHCCLLHWQAWAHTAGQARIRQEQQERLQEQQRLLAQQQEQVCVQRSRHARASSRAADTLSRARLYSAPASL